MAGFGDIETKLDTKRALQGAPALTRIFYACQSASFFEMLDREVDNQTSTYTDGINSAAEKYSKALDKILANNRFSLVNLDNGDLGKLADLTIGDKFKNLDQIRTIYGFYNPDKDTAFAAWDARKKLELLDRIDNNKNIQDILSNAKGRPLNEGEMITVASEVQLMQQSVYG